MQLVDATLSDQTANQKRSTLSTNDSSRIADDTSETQPSEAVSPGLCGPPPSPANVPSIK